MANSAAAGLVSFVLGFLLFSPAGAQQIAGALAREETAVASSESAEEKIPGLKSGSTAFWWSFLGTAVPSVASGVATYAHGSNPTEVPALLVLGGILLGPSLGHIYAARPGPALVGIGIRTLGLVGLGAAAGVALSEGAHSFSTNSIELVGVGSGILVLADLVWDIVRAPHSAQVRNDQLRRAPMSVGVSPYRGSAGPGLCARVAF